MKRGAVALAALAAVAWPLGCDLHDPRTFGSTCEHAEDCESRYACLETTRGKPKACESGTSRFVCTRPCTKDEDCAGLPSPAGTKPLCLSTCEDKAGSKVETACAPDPDKPWRLVCPGVCFWIGD